MTQRAIDIPYGQLPQLVKDNLSEEQWREIQPNIIMEGEPVPEQTQYINLMNGQMHVLDEGAKATGPLLAAHDLSGARE